MASKAYTVTRDANENGGVVCVWRGKPDDLTFDEDNGFWTNVDGFDGPLLELDPSDMKVLGIKNLRQGQIRRCIFSCEAVG